MSGILVRLAMASVVAVSAAVAMLLLVAVHGYTRWRRRSHAVAVGEWWVQLSRTAALVI